MTNIEVDRLPQKSLASIIAIEAHVLSQAQAADAMLRQQGNCLHQDGTKKRFTEYSGFQISTEEGTFSLSHRIMPCGDEGSYLKATHLKAIIVYNFSEGVPQNITEINDNVCKVMNASRKRKTRKTDVSPVKKVPKVTFEIDKLYAIALTDRWYPGRCIQIVDENAAVVDFLTPSGNYFKWPRKNNVQTVYTDGALLELTVESVSNGRLWSVVEKK